MMTQVLDGVMPIITQAVISILGILITFAIAKLSTYLTMKKQALIGKIGVEQYSFYQSLAESVYYGVEQQFKKAPGTDKKSEFDKRLLAKVPGLSQEDLDHFREAVVGKVRASATVLLEKPVPTTLPFMPQPFIPSIPCQPSPVWYDSSNPPMTTCNTTGDIAINTFSTGLIDNTFLAQNPPLPTCDSIQVPPLTYHEPLEIPEEPIVDIEEPLEHETEVDK